MKQSNHALIIFVILVLTSSTLLHLTISPAAIASANSSSDDWPMFRNNLTHTGFSTGTTTATSATLLWNYTTNGPVGSSPVIVDGKLYIGSLRGIAYCLNASTGTQIWNYTLQTRARSPRGDESSPAIGSSMAVENGYVYFGSYDRNVYCLNASTGDKVWNFTTGDTVESCPSVSNGFVYVGSWDGNIYCFNALTGEKIWNYTAGGLIESSPAVANGRIYVGSSNYNVYCLDASTGSEIWIYTTGNVVQSSPSLVGDYLYIGSEDNNLYCLNASSGDKKWSYATGGWVDSSPAVANGHVYVGSWIINSTDQNGNIPSNVYCLDATTGNKIWNYTTQGGVNSSPAVTDGYVYVGGYEGNVYCLSASTGEKVWSFTTKSFLNSSPAIANGCVYVASWDRSVYAFGVLYTPTQSPTPFSSQSTSPSPQAFWSLQTESVFVIAAAVVVIVLVALLLSRKRRRD